MRLYGGSTIVGHRTASSFDRFVYASISDPIIFRLYSSSSSLCMSSRVQYSLLMSSLKSFQGVALAAANPKI
ncbi:hypothetical protein HanIR_Chr13g0626461 [Helianthus annuus]|nr:hypothetical protein HanIR_Chr13g0626461 [Helianthus annuus]